MSPFHLLLTLLFACLTLSTPIVSNYNDDSSFPVEAPAEDQDYIITTSTVELQKRRPPVVLRYCLLNKKGCGQMEEDAFPTGGDEWSMRGSQLVRKLRLGLCYNFYWTPYLGEANDRIDSYNVENGCCTFYEHGNCLGRLFSATNRGDKNLKGRVGNGISSVMCDTRCAI